MIRRRPGLFWPLGAITVVVPSVLIAAIAFCSSADSLGWPFQEWVHTSAQFHQLLALTGPIAAAAAAYRAGRLLPQDRIYQPALARRSPGAIVGRDLGLLIGAFLVAYLIGLAPLLAATAGGADAGGLDVPVALTGLVGFAALTAIGYLIGLLGRSAFFAPVALLAVFVLTVAGSASDTFAGVLPVLHVAPRLGQVEATAFVLYRLAFFTVVLVVAVVLAARALTLRRAKRRLPAWQSAGLVLGVVALALPAVITTPALFALETEPPTRCRSLDDVDYCVHEGHASQLDPMIEAAAPRRQQVRRPQRPRAGHLVPSLAAHLSGSAVCFEKYGNEQSERQQVAFHLEQWPLVGPEGGPGLFATTPTDRMRQWIGEHEAAIAGCALTPGDLPR